MDYPVFESLASSALNRRSSVSVVREEGFEPPCSSFLV
jgi:hypothetical protein